MGWLSVEAFLSTFTYFISCYYRYSSKYVYSTRTHNYKYQGNVTLLWRCTIHNTIYGFACTCTYTHVYVTYVITYVISIYYTAADESDDELSIGAAIAITFTTTFIITLVVTALISIFFTSLYYKHWYKLKEKVTVYDDSTKQKDPYGDSITMDTDPAYATIAIIKMDTNPAYATTSH